METDYEPVDFEDSGVRPVSRRRYSYSELMKYINAGPENSVENGANNSDSQKDCATDCTVSGDDYTLLMQNTIDLILDEDDWIFDAWKEVSRDCKWFRKSLVFDAFCEGCYPDLYFLSQRFTRTVVYYAFVNKFGKSYVRGINPDTVELKSK